MLSYRKNMYRIFYRLKGSNDDVWYPYYRRRYTRDVANRKFEMLLSCKSPFEFTIVSESAE